MVDKGTKEIVDEILKELDRIPTKIESKVFMNDIMRELESRMKKDKRRYNSYVG